MNTKTAVLILVIVALAVGAWWFTSKDSNDDGVQDNKLLNGIISGVNAETKIFGFTEIEEVEQDGNKFYQDKHYTIRWTDETQFYFYANGTQIIDKTPMDTTSAELQKEASADIQTREGTGETRTAEKVWIYAGPGVPQLVE